MACGHCIDLTYSGVQTLSPYPLGFELRASGLKNCGDLCICENDGRNPKLDRGGHEDAVGGISDGSGDGGGGAAAAATAAAVGAAQLLILLRMLVTMMVRMMKPLIVAMRGDVWWFWQFWW